MMPTSKLHDTLAEYIAYIPAEELEVGNLVPYYSVDMPGEELICKVTHVKINKRGNRTFRISNSKLKSTSKEGNWFRSYDDDILECWVIPK